MKTTVYTYENKKVALFERPKFYLVKNEKELDKIIDDLITIDAVGTPMEINYPCVLKLESGFTPNLVLSTMKEYKRELKQSMKEVSQAVEKFKQFKKTTK